MKEKQYNDFSTAAEIIELLDLKFDDKYEKKISELMDQWTDIVGERIAKYSEPQELTNDGIMIISCKNSIVANEIFNSRQTINEEIQKRAKKTDINTFKYIKIKYS